MKKMDKQCLMQIITKALNEANIPTNTPAFPYYSFAIQMVAKGKWKPFDPNFYKIIANYFQTSIFKVTKLMLEACPPNTEPRGFINKTAETIKLLVKKEGMKRET